MPELRAQGKSLEEITRFVADAYAKRFLQPPSWPGVDYMWSSESIVVVDAEKGVVAPFPPHMMSYGAYLTNADPGSDGNPGRPRNHPWIKEKIVRYCTGEPFMNRNIQFEEESQ